MNISGYIVTLLVSFALGYVAYPVLFLSNAPKAKIFSESVTVRGPSGNVTLDIDVRKVKPEEVPEQIKAKEPIVLKAIDGDMSITLERGAIANVESFKDGMLKIKDPSGKFLGLVPWDQTDFSSGVATNRIKDMLGDPEAEKRAQQKAKEEENQKARALAAERRAAREEEKEVVEEKPKEKMTKEAGPLSKTVSDEEILTLMKGSVKSKAVSEFSLDGVTKWEAGSTDTIADVEYQIGFATYEKETIFGKQPVVGKCLIRDGIVKKWVYAKTGADIP